MAKKKSGKSLSREDATELYRDLQKTMKSMKGKPAQGKSKVSGSMAKQIATAIKQSIAKDDAEARSELGTDRAVRSQASSIPSRPVHRTSVPQGSGPFLAVSLVIFFAVAKLVFSTLEYSEVLEVEQARALLLPKAHKSSFTRPQYSREEAEILRSLDARRVQLEERRRKLDLREEDHRRRDREFAARLTHLRDITERLKVAREQSQQRRSSQLEQLSNVYGSMNPNEAAELIEQLDITIALRLLERMPEKRIGQILSLMSPDRALTITRMLSGTRVE